MVKLTEMTERSFARHETFHPRYSWFRKAYTHVAADDAIFSREDAPVEIGVGKNMVRAIRFWGTAARLITGESQKRAARCVPTRRGWALFDENGWDPYMEDPGTLWLLHWFLLAPKSKVPVWWLAFNEFSAVEFNETDLESSISTLLDAAVEWTKPHDTSIKKDINALLRAYAPTHKASRARFDDMLDCPLRELNLLRRSVATGRYRFTLGQKPTLPSEVLAYAVLDYVTLRAASSRNKTVILSRLAHESGAPGKAFKLTESELHDALEPAVYDEKKLELASPTGDVQLSWSGDPAAIATGILDRYYKPRKPRKSKICAGPEGDKPIKDNQMDTASDTHPDNKIRSKTRVGVS